MSKSAFIIAPVFAVILSASGVAQAAPNAEITITANVVAATCDVSLSKANLDLGNFTKTAFTAVLNPIASSVKTFTVGVNNCETPAAAADQASLIVSGPTLGGNETVFNSNSTNTGVLLSDVTSPTTYIKAGQKLLVATAGVVPAAGDFNGKFVTLQAGLTSTSLTPELGMVSAPILFSFAYN